MYRNKTHCPIQENGFCDNMNTFVIREGVRLA